MLYKQRIQETQVEADQVISLTKKLEQQEASMLQKLQNTYSQEQQVVKRLNQLSQLSPVMR